MCSATVALVGLQVVSGAIQARNQLAAGQAANNYYQYLAQQNERQAELAERTGRVQSRLIKESGSRQVKSFAESAAKQRSSQVAALASAGITGVTAEDISSDALRNQQLDESELRFNTDIQAFEAEQGAANQAFSLRTQAGGFRVAGSSARSASRRRAAGSLLGTVTSVLNPFNFFKSRR